MKTLAKLRAKLRKLEADAQEIRLLKQDYNHARAFRRLLVKQKFD